jgi:hypothetical protein
VIYVFCVILHLLVVVQAGDGATCCTLTKLTFSGDQRDSKPVTMEVGMTEADTSGAGLGPSGATVLSAWVRCKVLWSQLRIKSKMY